LAGWSLLHGLEGDEEEEQGVIEVVRLEKKAVTKGVVAYDGPGLEALGVKVGDTVGFKENRDYRLNIDGEECYRVRTEDLMYKEI
jgi:co-chaperonin GroES (HSP10)